jgi:glycosyltransferase involved in cell wall biosynthesis
VPNEDLFRWYRSVQALIMMSEAESFPMTSLEAMAAGCRVVCGSRPPFTELVARFPDAVYPAQVSSPRAVADRIGTATQTPGRVEANLSDYDWDSVAQATLTIFEKVASRAIYQ